MPLSMGIGQRPLCNKGLVKMSTTDDLEKWCETHIEKIRGFLGVFSENTLPSPDKITAPAVCIVNYDPSTLGGSHWVAIQLRPSSVAWFDSYGLSPDSPDLLIGHRTHFRTWLSRVCKRLGLNTYEFNSADLQSPGETTCGHWSAYFAKMGPEMGWEAFGADREHNDRIIRQLVRL